MTTPRLLALTLLSLALPGAALFAQTAPATPPPAAPSGAAPEPTSPFLSATIDATYASKYVWRGTQLATSSYQPQVEVNAGNAYLTVWSNQPVVKRVSDEVDTTLGFSPTFGDWTLDGGAIVYYYPEARTGRHTTEPFVGVSRSVASVTVSLYGYHDYMLHTTTEEAKLSREIELGKVLSLAPSLNGGRVEDHKLSYTYYGAGIEAPIKLGEHVKLTPGVDYATTRDLAKVKRNLTWGTLDLSVSF